MRWGRVVLIFLCCGASALGQKPLEVPPVGGQQRPASGPITLNVVVTDKKGEPISGLKQEDFTLLDDKQPAPIRSFQAHEIRSEPKNSEAIILLIDDVNGDFNVVSTIRTQIENYLHADGGHLAIPLGIFMLTDSGLKQLVPVGEDGNAMASVLHEKGAELHDIMRSAGFYGAEERLQLSLRSLGSLGSYLGQAEGRKLVVWIGPGWPIFDNPNVIISPQQQRNMFSGIVDLSTMLRDSGITLYSIDPLGPSDAASPRNFLWEGFTRPVTKPSQANPGDLALQVFANHSGGLVQAGSNDISGEIRKCTKDGEVWYTITFDPQKADSPNTWHDLAVKVDKPDMKVRTDNGYYAQPQQPAGTP
jgi:VWFA-related protein